MKALRSNPLFALALAFLSALALIGICAEPLLGATPGANGGAGTLLIWWARATHYLVLTTAIIGIGACVLGLSLGWLAAFGHRIFLVLFTKLSDVTGALPSLIFVGVLRVSHLIPLGLDLLVVLLALRSIEIGHSVRSLLLQQRTGDVMTAARSIGGSKFHIFRYHFLAHLVRPVAAASATTAAVVISLEASLSLVGLGLPPGSVSSWGTVLGAPNAVPFATAPAVALGSLVATTLALFIVGQSLRADRWIARRYI